MIGWLRSFVSPYLFDTWPTPIWNFKGVSSSDASCLTLTDTDSSAADFNNDQFNGKDAIQTGVVTVSPAFDGDNAAAAAGGFRAPAPCPVEEVVKDVNCRQVFQPLIPRRVTQREVAHFRRDCLEHPLAQQLAQPVSSLLATAAPQPCGQVQKQELLQQQDQRV